jgi:hypothetical protein
VGKSKSAVDIEALVKEALLKIANASNPLRLTGKGEDVVFSSTSSANKEAISRLKNETLPLLSENGSGKSATVSLTTAGFERIVDALTSEKLFEVVSKLSEKLTPFARVVFLQDLVHKSPQSIAGLVPLLEAATTAEKKEAEARLKEAEKQRVAEAASLAALEMWKALLQERKKQRIDTLKRELAAEGEEVEMVLPLQPKVPSKEAPKSAPLQFPEDEEDTSFRRNVARRLVSSWMEAWEKNKVDAREFLESAIWNISGFRPIGEIGQRLSFDGHYHEGSAGLFTGDIVKIIRPGWLLEEANDSEYVVLKAQVTQP